MVGYTLALLSAINLVSKRPRKCSAIVCMKAMEFKQCSYQRNGYFKQSINAAGVNHNHRIAPHKWDYWMRGKHLH